MEKPAQVTREAIVNAISVPFGGYLSREEKKSGERTWNEESQRGRRGMGEGGAAAPPRLHHEGLHRSVLREHE